MESLPIQNKRRLCTGRLLLYNMFACLCIQIFVATFADDI